MSVQADGAGGLSPVKRALLAVEEMRARLEAVEGARSEPIAITGIGCRFPGGAHDPAAFWRLLCEGVDAVREVPRERWDAAAIYSPDPGARGKTNARWGGFLDEVDRFDPAFFGISPREATHMDPQQRLVLEVAWEALEDAGLAFERVAGTQTGVFLGIYNNDYAWLQGRGLDEVDTYSATGAGQGIAANRVSYLLDLHGPSLSVDTTCSSSLVAVHLACQSLRGGECRMALAGGVNLLLSQLIALSVSKVVPMAADGRCKTFDAAADGIVRGEGCGIVVLKRLADALADGDDIVAVIRGTAANQDGRSNGFTAPSSAAQQAVIRQALRNAGLKASDISYVEAHGTGTPLGDPIELEALDSVLGGQRAPSDPCAVGSVKTNVGHLEAAAGIAGLIKVALSLRHRAIPPHLHFTKLNPHVSLANGSFEIPTGLRPWGRAGERLCAGVSSFSLGGTNAHIILAEAPATPAEATPADATPVEATPDRAYLLPISARSDDALEALARNYRGLLLEAETAGAQRLYELAYNTGLRRSHLPHRLALVGRTAREMVTLLDNFLDKETHPGLSSGKARGERRGLVFVYSGQGTQWRGMGRRLWEREPAFGAALEQCHELFRQFGSISLLDELKSEADDARLAEPRFAQPSIFAVQVALTALLREWGIAPDAVVGHSSGELVAAHAAGILSLSDAARIVSARARLFDRIAGQGGMAAVELPAEEIRPLLKGWSGEVSVAASNSPTSTVLSGEIVALRGVVEALRTRHVQCRYLQVGCAYHSRQVDPLLPELAEELRDIRPQPGLIPFVSTVTTSVVAGERLVADYWVRNAREQVSFDGAVEHLKEDYDLFLEVGPHPSLSGHLARCLQAGGRATAVLPTLRRDSDERTMLLRSLGALYALGHAVNWGRLTPTPARHVKLPSYPWRRARYWTQEEPKSSQHAPADAADLRETEAGSHPLLGRRLRTPLQVFETRVVAGGLHQLNRHRIGGEAVFPAAGYLEMALAAAVECLPSGPCDVRGMVFHERLVIPEDGARTVQSILTPEGQGINAFQIFGLGQDAGEGEPRWTLHAAGMICKAVWPDGETARPTLARLQEIFVDEFPAEEFRRLLGERGFHGGEDLPGVARLWRKSGAALGCVRLPQQATEEGMAYQFHPALLDACFQTLFAALPDGEVDDGDAAVYISAGVARFTRLRAHGPEVWSHVVVSRPEESALDRLTADFRIYDADGAIVAEVEGLSLRRLALRSLTGAGRAADEFMYEIQWEPKALDGDGNRQPSSRLPVSVLELANGLRPLTPAAIEKFGLRQYLEVEPEVDALCAAYAAGALRDLGLDLRACRRIADGSFPARLGVLPRYERLLGRLFEMLCEDGILAADGDGWEVRKTPETGATAHLARRLADAHPTFGTELTLLARCGPELPKVLRGASDPLELLFPGGALAEAEQLYQASPFARTFNTLVEQAMRHALESLPRDATVRVLEVGAGTGGTTASVLPLMPKARTEYFFTDVSNLFLFNARRKFGDYSFVNYKLLDIERDPLEQGFSAEGFDVVIAANVLHGTRDLRRALTQVRRLLAPDGLLLLLESTGPQRLVDLTFGLTEDWWSFTDTELRPNHPLLSADKWLDLLGEVGFRASTTVPAPADTEQANLQTALILAQAPPAGDDPRVEADDAAGDDCRGSWLLFTDDNGVGDRLAESLRARGGTAVQVYAGAAFGQRGESRWSVNPAEPEDFRRLMRESLHTSPCRGVVYLWSLGAEAAPESTSADALGCAALDECGSVLGIVQAMAHDKSPIPPRLWIVTRGARSVAEDDATVTLSASPLWGLGPVVATEHAEVWGGLIDLPATSRPTNTKRCWGRYSADAVRIRWRCVAAAGGTSRV